MGLEDVPPCPDAPGAVMLVSGTSHALTPSPRIALPPASPKEESSKFFPCNLAAQRLGAPRGQGLGLTHFGVPQRLAHAVSEAGC